jgi:hypothetical protein
MVKHTSAYLVVAVGLCLVAAGPLAAHHSTAAVYDISKVVTLKGIVTEFTMMNPHGSLSLTVEDAAGNSANWVVELPTALFLVGKGLNRNTLRQGDEITVEVWVSKKGAGRAVSRMLHLPSGQAISTATAWDCGSAAQEGCAGPGRLAPVTKQ